MKLRVAKSPWVYALCFTNVTKKCYELAHACGVFYADSASLFFPLVTSSIKALPSERVYKALQLSPLLFSAFFIALCCL